MKVFSLSPRSFVASACLGLLAAQSASALPPPLPAAFQFQCSSPEIGVFELNLSKPEKQTISDGVMYYELEVTRKSASGQVIQKDTYPAREGSVEASARYMRLESENNLIYFSIPVANVDWEKNKDKCFAKAPAPGIMFTLDLSGGSPIVPNVKYNEPTLSLEQQNPRVEFRKSDYIAYVTIPYLGTSDCPSQNPASKIISAPIQCRVVR